jgi:hypothetical protein
VLSKKERMSPSVCALDYTIQDTLIEKNKVSGLMHKISKFTIRLQIKVGTPRASTDTQTTGTEEKVQKQALRNTAPLVHGDMF